jgi:hypothetical protein
MMNFREYMDTIRERFPGRDRAEAMWIWDTIIVPLQAELKSAEESRDDALSGWPDGLEY